MNWYEHHIRDYDAATQHLTWDQDMAYARLLRWYYRKERPIPADLSEACRQVRATSKAQRQAVEAVLQEFFVLQDDGWHQETCDAAIAAYHDGEPEREQKKVNEDTRLKRHREERAALFRTLNSHGRHAPWNTKIEELRAIAATLSVPTETAAGTVGKPLPATAPATPATATHGNVSPTTTHQPPPTTPQGIEDSVPDGTGAAGAARPGQPPAPPAPTPPLPTPAPADDLNPLTAGERALTADEAAALTKAELWRAGKSLLSEQKMPEKQCGTFVGKLVRDYGDDIVIEAVRAAVVQRPADVASWLVASCKAAMGRAGGKPGQLTGDQQIAASLAKAARIQAAMAATNGAARPVVSDQGVIDG